MAQIVKTGIAEVNKPTLSTNSVTNSTENLQWNGGTSSGAGGGSTWEAPINISIPPQNTILEDKTPWGLILILFLFFIFKDDDDEQKKRTKK